jgi:peptidyl-prolyl cis-trans isomerase C
MTQSKVLAVVKTREITTDEINAILRGMDPQQAAQYRSPEGLRRLLDEVVHRELLYLDAVDSGLEQEEAFQRMLEQTKENLLKEFAFRNLFDSITIEDAEARAYYREHKEDFMNPVSIKASHILLKDEARAHEVHKSIENGTTFEEAAKQHSDCEGQDLGYFEKGKMVQEFEDVAFSMAVGEVSKPVKSPFGSHIIKVYDRKIGKGREYVEVKKELSQFLLERKREQTYFGKIRNLQEKYPVEIKE